MAPNYGSYLEKAHDVLKQAGLGDEFTYHGSLDRQGKLDFLRSLDVLSVPATYDEPKGMFLLESMAAGVPGRSATARRVHRGRREDRRRFAGAPRRSWMRWRRDCTGCGPIARCPRRLADRAFEGVRAHYTIAQSAVRLIEVYESARPSRQAGLPC